MLKLLLIATLAMAVAGNHHPCHDDTPVLINGKFMPSCCVFYSPRPPASVPSICSNHLRSTLNEGKITTYQNLNNWSSNMTATFGFYDTFTPLVTSGPNLEVAAKSVLSDGTNIAARLFWRGDLNSLYAELYACTDGTEQICVIGASFELGRNPYAMYGTLTIVKNLTSDGYRYVATWILGSYTLQYTYESHATSATAIKLQASVGNPGMSDCASYSWRNYAYMTSVTADGLTRADTSFSRLENQAHPATGSCVADDGQVYYRV